jgi:hypothetical protein
MHILKIILIGITQLKNMKKFLEKSQNNFFVIINGLLLFLYLISFYLEKKVGIDFFLNIFGLAYLVFLTPYNLLRIINSFIYVPNKERFLSYLILYFFLYVPLFFFLNNFFDYFLNTTNILILNLIIFLISLIITKNKKFPIDKILFEKKDLLKNWPLIVGLFLFGLVHSINFYFYKFIPEWDGYSDMLKIENVVSTQLLSVEYRGFFVSSASIMSSFTKIDPYQLFAFWFIALQTTIIIVTHKLLKEYDIKNKIIQLIVILAALSVPVINMEIDMTRPQNITIAFLPVFIYFIYKALKEKTTYYWFMTGIICIFGINYHEFFVFFLGVFSIFFLMHIFKKYPINSKDQKNKLILILIAIIVFLLLFLANQYINSFSFVIQVFKNIINNITHTENWRWWFLGNYNTDGPDLQLGWPGITGAIQYYGYYLSPAVLFTFLTSFYFYFKNKFLLKDLLVLIILPFLIIFLAFAEIFPRINFVFLPERFWVFIDILILITIIPLIKNLEKLNLTDKTRKIILYLGIISIIIGIGGSFFIAKNKMALTTEEEKPAIEWIKNNTPKNSLFITQSSNGPLIRFFAKRKMAPSSELFFISDSLQPLDIKIELENLKKQKEELENKISLELNRLLNNKNITENELPKLENLFESVAKIKNEINRKELEEKTSLYILYSKNKFSSLYAQREWWLKANFFGANLEKFNNNYELVYNKNNVLIWKIR